MSSSVCAALVLKQSPEHATSLAGATEIVQKQPDFYRRISQLGQNADTGGFF